MTDKPIMELMISAKLAAVCMAPLNMIDMVRDIPTQWISKVRNGPLSAVRLFAATPRCA